MLSDFLVSKPFKSALEAKEAGPPSLGGGPPSGGPTFLTPASLVTFAGATFAIKIVMQVITKLFSLQDSDPKLLWIGFAVSIVIGIGIVFLTLTAPGGKPTNSNQWVGALMVAVINILYLYLAAIAIPLPAVVASSQNGNTTAHAPAVPGIQTNH